MSAPKIWSHMLPNQIPSAHFLAKRIITTKIILCYWLGIRRLNGSSRTPGAQTGVWVDMLTYQEMLKMTAVLEDKCSWEVNKALRLTAVFKIVKFVLKIFTAQNASPDISCPIKTVLTSVLNATMKIVPNARTMLVTVKLVSSVTPCTSHNKSVKFLSFQIVSLL